MTVKCLQCSLFVALNVALTKFLSVWVYCHAPLEGHRGMNHQARLGLEHGPHQHLRLGYLRVAMEHLDL